MYFPRYHAGRLAVERAKQTARASLSSKAFEEFAVLERSILLKPFVSEKEPGLLLVSFENELAKLALLSRLPALERAYRIAFLPTWQPFYSEPLYLLEARAALPFFLMPSAFSEQDLCGRFSDKCKFLPFHAASWVSSGRYPTPSSTRSVDLLMIANFSRHKRHWKLFEALRDMPPSLRVVVAGVPLAGRSAQSLLREAKLFGVEKRIRIVEKPTDDELRALLRNARLFCAMTHKEGSYIAVAEALMAGVPVAMLRSAVVGSKAYINAETGFLLDPSKPLAQELTTALSKCDELRPQDWAKQNISAEINSAILNSQIRQILLAEHQEWTSDLEPFFCEHFEFRYFDAGAETRLRKDYTYLQSEFGLTIRRP
jgi:glycosyltransferase involved in cell wall biosynthesis